MSQLDRLGLRENPFNKNIDQRYFYADKKRAQILESTEHLIDYSSNFQVIVGEQGMGKSHLLEVLASRIDNNWRVAKISIAEQTDTLSLIQILLNSFGALTDEHVEPLESLETQLAEINQLGFKPVLFIDDAQALSIDSLRFLIQLSQQKQDDTPYINIILFATTQLTELLQSPEIKVFRNIVHIAALEKLDKEGVSGYLRHKMAVAGFDRETPFTPRIIDSIYKDSDGVPRQVDIFADKFLASSGKADNYIDSGNQYKADSNPEPVLDDNKADNINQDINSMDSLDDVDLAGHRGDRAEAQLNRLAKKFAEIEQMDKQSEDNIVAESDSDYSEEYDAILRNEGDLAESGLPKFVIPLAVIAILSIALLVINTVFKQSAQNPDQTNKEQIDLLPLELPPEQQAVKEQTVAEIIVAEPMAAQQNLSQKQAAQTDSEKAPIPEPGAEKVSDTSAEIELIEATDLSLNKQKIPQQSIATTAAEQVKTAEIIPVKDQKSAPAVSLKITPKLTAVEPEPVIGSNSRQYITLIGKNLEQDTQLMVSWAGNKKEFSKKQTPEQWQYTNKGQIKLHLNVGTTSQQWKISAKNTDTLQSPEISFAVVRPFISPMSIKGISPKPFIGSDKRQTVRIEGNGFSKQTVIELRWDKNKKHFSARLTPNQFEFVNSSQIKLFIATGIKKRKWTVVAISPAGKTSTSSFIVTSESAAKLTIIKSSSDTLIKDEKWLKQQADTNYTIQLSGSHSKQAIDDLVKKYALKGDVLIYTTQLNGNSWYILTYGNYQSKQLAESAVAKLDPALTKTSWVRNFASIKDQLAVKASISSTVVKKISKPVQTVNSGIKSEAWIWTQNPADYTIQLIALSTEAGVKTYIKKNAVQSKSAYFKTMRKGKPLYILLYGSFADKNSAQQASKQLAATISGSKPWVRNFSAVHGMMNSR